MRVVFAETKVAQMFIRHFTGGDIFISLYMNRKERKHTTISIEWNTLAWIV